MLLVVLVFPDLFVIFALRVFLVLSSRSSCFPVLLLFLFNILAVLLVFLFSRTSTIDS